MSAPQATLIGQEDRLHLQHGPIDLIIGLDSRQDGARETAFAAATERFGTVLAELSDELDLLRAPFGPDSAVPEGVIARRMYDAVQPHAGAVFITPMAAVAGAVADEVLQSLVAAVPLSRAYVNNGGDIALHLSEETRYTIAIAGLDGQCLGTISLPEKAGIRGIATSGQGGRSQSCGIAESVTVLAKCAASADAAATLIANAVDLPDHPAIRREAANIQHPDSDLGDRQIVTHVGQLSPADIGLALDRGLSVAYAMHRAGLILGTHLKLREQKRLIGQIPLQPSTRSAEVSHV